MILNQRQVFDGHVIRVTVDTVELPNSYRAELEIVHHPGGAAIVAVDDQERVCLLRQFRHAADGYIWEIPAGKLEPAELPSETARRELVEEAGRYASRWRSLGTYVSSPGVFTERVHLFLAEDLSPAPHAHEAAEVMEVHWIALSEAVQQVHDGVLQDGKTCLALLKAAHLRQIGVRG